MLPVKDFLDNFNKHKHESEIRDFMKPYLEFEEWLRASYAKRKSIKRKENNILEITDGKIDIQFHQWKRSKYIMPLILPPKGTAINWTGKGFKCNFLHLTHSRLRALDWNNVVAAGGSVCLSLLYEEGQELDEMAGRSDIDLFIYGLDENAAEYKLRRIISSIISCTDVDTRLVRTKNAVTIVADHPKRHIQIILRCYSSISEILTGFDIDSSCVAYNGKEIFASPRAITAFITRCNVIDLDRCSSSYAYRLLKYQTRGFEIYSKDFDRQRIRPELTTWAARPTRKDLTLLVPEFLHLQPSAQRQILQTLEEDSPSIDLALEKVRGLGWLLILEKAGPEKATDVLRWMEIPGDYDFAIPYRAYWSAKNIVEFLAKQDDSFNNQPLKNGSGEREHRHLFVCGSIDTIFDKTGCGICENPQQYHVSIKDDRHVDGPIKFLMENPGRQKIGSFKPMDSDVWTKDAYM